MHTLILFYFIFYFFRGAGLLRLYQPITSIKKFENFSIYDDLAINFDQL
jgi:hypothetical protein